MSSLKNICIYITTQKYGKDAGILTDTMITHGESSIADLKNLSQIESKKLRQLMIIFFKMGFIVQSDTKNTNFKIQTSSILEHSRDLIYLNFINSRFGQLSKSLVKTLMLNGVMEHEECIEQTFEFYQMIKSTKGSSSSIGAV